MMINMGEGLERDPSGDAVFARYVLLEMSSREWDAHCWALAGPVLDRILKKGPYVFRDQVPVGDERAFVMTKDKMENELFLGTGLSGWRVSFDQLTHKIVVRNPDRPRG